MICSLLDLMVLVSFHDICHSCTICDFASATLNSLRTCSFKYTGRGRNRSYSRISKYLASKVFVTSAVFTLHKWFYLCQDVRRTEATVHDCSPCEAPHPGSRPHCPVSRGWWRGAEVGAVPPLPASPLVSCRPPQPIPAHRHLVNFGISQKQKHIFVTPKKMKNLVRKKRTY